MKNKQTNKQTNRHVIKNKFNGIPTKKNAEKEKKKKRKRKEKEKKRKEEKKKEEIGNLSIKEILTFLLWK